VAKGKKNELTETKGTQNGTKQKKQSDKKHKKEKSTKTKSENTKQQNDQSMLVKPSVVCIVPSGSADWLSFNNYVVLQPDGELSLRPMVVAPKRSHHMYSMAPSTVLSLDNYSFPRESTAHTFFVTNLINDFA
jgi:hypothetical protein